MVSVPAVAQYLPLAQTASGNVGRSGLELGDEIILGY